MSTTIATTEQRTPAKIGELLARDTVRLALMNALGGSMGTDYFISQMNIALNKDDKLKACSLNSKFEAANICASLGLLPTLGQVALIPRANSVTVMPQWQGFQALMLRCPEVKHVKAVLIHRLDSYEFNAETEQLRHTYDPFAECRVFKDWKDLQGGYLVVEYNDGRPRMYHCVSVDTMRKARGCAQADNIWQKWFAEQCLKTVYRNAFARRVIPMDHIGGQRLKQLEEIEDTAVGNDPERVESADVVPVQQISRVEQVKAARKSEPVQPEPEPEYVEPESTTEVNELTPEAIEMLRGAVRAAWPKATPAKLAAMWKEWGIDNPNDDECFDLFVMPTIWEAVEKQNEASKE